MNWINKLLRKPATPATKPSLPKPSAKERPLDETDQLRRALLDAAGDEEQRQAVGRLGRALAELRQAPRGEDAPGVRAAAICQVADKALALDWLAGLAGDAWLGEVASQGRISDVRLAALQRIEEAAVLERVAQANRDKDKRVYRLCVERLRQRRQADDGGRRAATLAAELRQLLDSATIPLSRTIDLEREVRSLPAGLPAIADCQTLLEQAHARLQQESQAQRDLQARLAAARQLLGECADRALKETARLDDWRDRRQTLAEAQARLPSWLASQAAARTLDELLDGIERRLAELAADAGIAAACEEFLAALVASPPADAASRDSQAAAWAALPKPEDPASRHALQERWLALQAPPVAAAAPVKPDVPSPVRIDQEALRALLQKLEQDVEQGQLAEAEVTAAALGGVLAGQVLHGPLESRWQRASAQLANLRGWARWGAEEAREHLVLAAEQLLIGTPGVDDLARDVKGLREKWKQLNAHGPTKKDQWERFDAALRKAYEPVAARHEAEAARQAEAGAAKASLCDEWESQVAAIDAQHLDGKALEARRQEMLRRWRGAAQAGHRDERNLHKRFDKLLKAIDQRLDAVRAAEMQRREELIAEADTLREESDLARAMTAAKVLQERWTGQALPVRLDRKADQALWQRFRAACAEVFARRDARRAEQAARREERSLAVQGLLDELAASLSGSDANAIRRALGRIGKDWDTVKTDARDFPAGLAKRAQDLRRQAQERLDRLLHEKHGAHFALLAQKAALAEGVESAAAAMQPVEAVLAAAREAWNNLPRLPGKSEAPLAERLAKAPTVTASALAAGREAREALLLDLEIALGLPSPEAMAEARRRRQLEQLQNRFAADSRHAAAAEALLDRWYATAAVSDPALDQRIVAVTNRLLDESIRNSG